MFPPLSTHPTASACKGGGEAVIPPLYCPNCVITCTKLYLYSDSSTEPKYETMFCGITVQFNMFIWGDKIAKRYININNKLLDQQTLITKQTPRKIIIWSKQIHMLNQKVSASDKYYLNETRGGGGSKAIWLFEPHSRHMSLKLQNNQHFLPLNPAFPSYVWWVLTFVPPRNFILVLYS